MRDRRGQADRRPGGDTGLAAGERLGAGRDDDRRSAAVGVLRIGEANGAAAEPERFVVIDGEGYAADIFERVVAEVQKRTELPR